MDGPFVEMTAKLRRLPERTLTPLTPRPANEPGRNAAQPRLSVPWAVRFRRRQCHAMLPLVTIELICPPVGQTR